MRVGRLLAPIHSLGPGSRVGLWTQGCKKNCKGCLSPERKPDIPEKEIPCELLKTLICQAAVRGGCRGITISGGDPMEQPEELLKLLTAIREDFEDILVYTGFEYEQIADGSLGIAAKQCLSYIDVLIDGPYVEEKNRPEAVLRGSENQRIIFLTNEKTALTDAYKAYLAEGRFLENFIHKGALLTVGIPDGEHNC